MLFAATCTDRLPKLDLLLYLGDCAEVEEQILLKQQVSQLTKQILLLVSKEPSNACSCANESSQLANKRTAYSLASTASPALNNYQHLQETGRLSASSQWCCSIVTSKRMSSRPSTQHNSYQYQGESGQYGLAWNCHTAEIVHLTMNQFL